MTNIAKIETTSLDKQDEQQQYHFRSVSRIIDSEETTEGGGFVVHRPFPTNALLDFDPFLLLDEWVLKI
jgi:hypothetical protein